MSDADMITVRWTTTETTTYQTEIDADEWARMRDDGTALDELSEYEEPLHEQKYENDREIDEVVSFVPTVGQLAWHVDGLDPRPVAEVSTDGKKIKISIGDHITPWVPAGNYTYTEAPV